MNIYEELRNKDIKLLNQQGFRIEDREYDLKELTEMVVKVSNYVFENREILGGKERLLYEDMYQAVQRLMYAQWLKERAGTLEDDARDSKRPGKKKYTYLNSWMEGTAYNTGMLPGRKIKIEDYIIKGWETLSVVVTMGRKNTYGRGEGHIPYAIDRRIRDFQHFLEDALVPSEELLYRNKSFCIKGVSYEINYYIEAYKKETNKRCYVENYNPVVERLDRRGVIEVYREMRNHKEKIEGVFRSMQNTDLKEQFPNAADRFVYLCELAQR